VAIREQGNTLRSGISTLASLPPVRRNGHIRELTHHDFGHRSPRQAGDLDAIANEARIRTDEARGQDLLAEETPVDASE
jgi:hypothetical protein